MEQSTYHPAMGFDTNRYDGRMPYRRCGDSGLWFPEISLGCWHHFGANDDSGVARQTLRRAFDRGIIHWDLANNYGPPPGAAESVVGSILTSDFSSHRDELLISTKAGHDMWAGPCGKGGSRKHLLASLEQSLRRLNLDYVDVFYSHCPDPDTRLEETMGALATAVKSGKALYVGLSKYPLGRLRDAVALLADLGVRCVVYQPPYSMLRRDVEATGILSWLHGQDIGSVVFSPLAQGMLTGKYLAGIPADSRAAIPGGFLKPGQVASQMDTIRKLNSLAESYGMPLHHLALKWALRLPSVTSAIIGARNPEQLDDTLAALNHPVLPNELLQEIDLLCPA